MRRDTGRVYAIINRVTGRTYIGSTVKTVTERFSAHRSRLNVGMHENPALQADWRQFGSAAFDVVELETVHYPGSNLHQEEYWIRTYRERGTDLYNSRAIFSAAPPRLERPNASAAALARRRWRNRTEDKVCPFCKQPFKGDKRQTYCTPAHQNAAAVRRFRERERRQGAAQVNQ